MICLLTSAENNLRACGKGTLWKNCPVVTGAILHRVLRLSRDMFEQNSQHHINDNRWMYCCHLWAVDGWAWYLCWRHHKYPFLIVTQSILVPVCPSGVTTMFCLQLLLTMNVIMGQRQHWAARVISHLADVLATRMGLGLELNHQSKKPFFFSLRPPMPAISLRLGISCRVGSSPRRGWVSSLSGSPVLLLGLATSSGCRGGKVPFDEDLWYQQLWGEASGL